MPRVVHGEIHADDPARAVAFYSEIFGWTIKQWGAVEYWLATTGEGPGINGAIVPRRGPRPAAGQPVNAHAWTIEVDDLDAYLARVLARGGALAVPRVPIPGVGGSRTATTPRGPSSG